MGMRIDNKFKYFKDINEALKQKYQTTEDFPYSQMATAIDDIPSGGGTLIPKTITENGVYNASSDNADGYDVVTVGVPERNTLDELFADTLEVANIPSATSLADYLFKDRKNLINVIMPNVTSIGQEAFNGCTNLALTSLPSGLTSIGQQAFDGCTNLALTSLPSGLTSIGYQAFNGCTNLALTSLPSGLTSIDSSAFNGCTNLALTSLPSGLTSIGNNVFKNCTNLALTSLPSGVTSIGNRAFSGCISILFLDFSDFTQIPTLGVRPFELTSFPFYFRDQQQLDEWAADTNWSIYADRCQIKPSRGI